MTDITFFTTEELGLLKRILAFAANDVPITDIMGNRIWPTTETRELALALESKLEEAGVATPGQLFSAYDPQKLVDRVSTIRWTSDENVEYNIQGKVSEVRENNGAYTVVFPDGGEFFFESRDELQKNSRVELEQP